MLNFSEALEHLKANQIVKRKVIKNDTVIINYKNRLYQMSRDTGVRYPYVPTNADLMAEDYITLGGKICDEALVTTHRHGEVVYVCTNFGIKEAAIRENNVAEQFQVRFTDDEQNVVDYPFWFTDEQLFETKTLLIASLSK